MRFVVAVLALLFSGFAHAQSIPFPGPGLVAGACATTWNPADKGANITLSNGNLSTAGATAFNSVRATVSKASGAWYWENKVTAVTGGASVVGFGNASMSLTSFVGNSTTSVGVQTGGAISASAGFTVAVVTGVTWAANDFMNFAIDLTAGKMWIGKNGTWTSGSPAAGTLPNVTFTGGTLTLFPAWSSADASNTGTANFGATIFNGTVPVGFAGCWK
jgi:hypothetical protein